MLLPELLALLATRRAVLVQVTATQGSTPREAGAWMAVFEDRVLGTIGGGRLEFDAIARARQRLAGMGAAGAAGAAGAEAGATLERTALGPSLGQCCGGAVELRYQPVSQQDAPALRTQLAQRTTPVALFGGGHVGRAIVGVLAPLPFAVRWIDSRDQIFPAVVPSNVVCEHSDPVQAAVPELAAGSHVLILSFSHAEDLDVVAACLGRQRAQGDLASIGLIGSRTKWATFRHRLEARGFSAPELAGVDCPIGLPGIEGKEPAVIAVGVAARLLQRRLPATD